MNDQGKATLVYDGNCDFCRWWVTRWGWLAMDRVQFAPADRWRYTSTPRSPDSVELLDVDGKRYKGAEAVFRASRCGGFLWLYNHVSAFRFLAECGYRCIAGSRGVLSRLIRRP